MEIKNQLNLTTRQEFREWLSANASTSKECWLSVNRAKTDQSGIIWYIDAVEEALCFGWIDSTLKTSDGITIQRFSPRTKQSNWTELNKERCRRLIKLGLMTKLGLAILPDLDKQFEILPEIEAALKENPEAWRNFNTFPELYRRVRIDKIQNDLQRNRPECYETKLRKLIEASENGLMIGDWNDFGRLLDY